MKVLKNCNKRNRTFGSLGPQARAYLINVHVLSRDYESQKGVQK